MERVDEVLHVKTTLPDVENLQDEGEKRNAAKHHRRDVAPQRFEEKFRPGSVLPDLFFDLLFEPKCERRLLLPGHPGGEMKRCLWRCRDGGGRNRRLNDCGRT